MGFFDFFKKTTCQSFQIDFVNYLGCRLGDSHVVFGNDGPGRFSVNDKIFTLHNEYVDDIGYSSDHKYRRIATKEFCFWVKPTDYDRFLSCINKTLRESEFNLENIVSFDEYLGIDRTFFELENEFNITGVSHNFGQNTAEIIASFSAGDTLSLMLATDRQDDENCIKVVDTKGRQIGWMPYNLESPSYENLELLNQLKSGLRQVAYVVDRGQVRGKPYWWCAVRFKLKIPYNRSEETVYISPGSSIYHVFPDCKSAATLQIPKFYAEKSMRTLCQKCKKRQSPLL